MILSGCGGAEGTARRVPQGTVVLDDGGNPVLDANGNPVYVDENGDQIVTDENGDAVIDENGNQVTVDTTSMAAGSSAQPTGAGTSAAAAGGMASGSGGSTTEETGTAAGGASGAQGGSSMGGSGMAGGNVSSAGDPAAAGMPSDDEPADGVDSGESGDGFLRDGQCFPACASPDNQDGNNDGYSFENGVSCIVPGSAPSQGAASCDPGTGGSTDPSDPADPAEPDNTGNPDNTSNPGGGTGDGTCPAQLDCPNNRDCGCYNVAGLGERKLEFFAAGASDYMIASAMMETEDLGTDYPYGDNKTGDSFNAGTCKQNWGMIRECYEPWRGQGQNQYATAAAMNDDLALDVSVYAACRDYYGDLWWAGHRAGWAGLNGVHNQADIDLFKNAMDWTYQMLSEGQHFQDNIRFWADVAPI